MKKILSVVLMAAIVLSVAGCAGNGGSEDIDFDAIGEKIENMSDDELENAILDGAEKLEGIGETTTTAAQTEAAPKEESYEPLQEIIDADLSSGLVQIGDDIFKNGGYMTVNEFIAQYGDKYDTSAISVEGYLGASSFENVTVKKVDSQIELNISYLNMTDDMIKIGDAVIEKVYPSGNIQEFTYQNTWMPGGILSSLFKYEDFVAIAEADGFVEVEFNKYDISTGTFALEKVYDTYMLYMFAEVAEENIYGVKPFLRMGATFDMNNGVVQGFNYNGIDELGK